MSKSTANAKGKSKGKSKRRNGPSPLLLLVGGGIVVLGLVVGAFLYLTRDTSEPPLTISDDTEDRCQATDPATLDGVWRAVAGGGDNRTSAGYRVDEVFAAGARKSTANGRTNNVTGTLTVADGTVTEGEITIDLSTLTSDVGRRDEALKTRGLQTDEFPEGTFVLTEPVVLPKIPAGKTFTAMAVGELTLHGVAHPTEIEVSGCVVGENVTLNGGSPVVLADHGMEAPSIGGFVEVADQGTFEFIVNFVPT